MNKSLGILKTEELAHMFGRNFWINLEAAHQSCIFQINPWKKCNDLRLFSKHYAVI